MTAWDFSPGTPLGTLYNDTLALDEYATKDFWSYFFVNYIFCGLEWVISSEQPPRHHHSQRRIDLVVKRWQDARFYVLLFLEAKKGKATPEDIATVETQGYTAGFEFLQDNSDRDAVWVSTVYGPYARLWVLRRQGPGFLEPLFPARHDIGERSAYLNIRDNQEDFAKYFGYMVDNPFPDDNLVEGILAFIDEDVGGASTVAGPSTEAGPSIEAGPSTEAGPNVINPETSIYVTVEKIGKKEVHCRTVNGINVKLGNKWGKSHVWYKGVWCSCRDTEMDGQIYYTWTLEAGGKGKGSGKGKK